MAGKTWPSFTVVDWRVERLAAELPIRPRDLGDDALMLDPAGVQAEVDPPRRFDDVAPGRSGGDARRRRWPGCSGHANGGP
jgi:hypothetical protein